MPERQMRERYMRERQMLEFLAVRPGQKRLAARLPDAPAGQQ
jgi:hypothetical protein